MPSAPGRQRGEAWSAFNDAKEARNPFTGALSKELDPEDAMTAWEIKDRKGTKKDPYTEREKKQDMREELDLTTAEVNWLWDLMVRALKE